MITTADTTIKNNQFDAERNIIDVFEYIYNLPQIFKSFINDNVKKEGLIVISLSTLTKY